MALPPGNDRSLELIAADTYAQYLLSEPREIAFVLRQLAAHRAMTTAYFGNTQDFLLTAVIEVSADNRHVFLDLGTDEELIARALADNHLLCATQLEKVKIQFPIKNLERTEYEGFPAMRASLPATLLRLQRREYYRLSTPSIDSLNCQIPLPGGRKINTRVLDISGGGIAIIAPPEGNDLELDKVFDNCRLDLPDSGPVIVSIQIRNLFRIKTRGGQDVLRAGCQLLNLPANAANVIQRYILKAERERNQYRN
jgi:c-di-GMP-binding flagellar brake protein YcgR